MRHPCSCHCRDCGSLFVNQSITDLSFQNVDVIGDEDLCGCGAFCKTLGQVLKNEKEIEIERVALARLGL
jgi:hypothetical protein